MVALGLGSAARAEDLELAVKAAYLYKLAPFVDWPPGALDPQGPFNLCVVGRDPFGSVLDRAVAGQVIGGRPIAVRRLRTIDKGSGCQPARKASWQPDPLSMVRRRRTAMGRPPNR